MQGNNNRKKDNKKVLDFSYDLFYNSTKVKTISLKSAKVQSFNVRKYKKIDGTKIKVL